MTITLKQIRFANILILLTLFACEEPIVPVPDCNPNPCAENACEPDSCRFQDTTTIDTNPDSTFLGLDTAWTSPLPEDFGVKKSVQGQDNIYLACINSNSHLLVCIQKKTGNILWTFSDPNVDYFADIHFHEPSQTLIAQRNKRIIALSGGSGQLLSTSSPSNYNSSATYGSLLGDYYYLPVRSGDSQKGFILRAHVSDLTHWEEIYEVHTDDVDGSRPSMNSMNNWIHPITNDEILVFQHRMSFPRRIDLLAYNLTADSILWWHKDVDPNGNSNIQQINIFDDKVVFFSARLVHCVDLPSGDILWQSNLNENQERNFMGASATLTYDNQLIIANGRVTNEPPFNFLYLTFVDASTGQVIEEIDGISTAHLTAHQNLVFMAGQNRCYDLNQNKFIWDTNIEEIYHGLGHTLVDFDRRVYYAAFPWRDQGYFGAWKIPDEWF